MNLLSYSRLTIVILILTFVWISCRHPTPDVVQPKSPSLPDTLWRQDPASLIAGIYTGQIFTQTPTRFGLIAGDGQLLIQRLSAYRISIHSIWGQMNTYQIKLMVSGDTVKSTAGQAIDLFILIKNKQPDDFHARATSAIEFNEIGPSLFHFNRLMLVPFQPITDYQSNSTAQPLLHFLTGIYCGEYPVKLNDERRYHFTPKPVAVRQLSSQEVELFDINDGRKRTRFSLHKNENDSSWVGESENVTLRFLIKNGQPQRFTIQPKSADTTSIGGWPPLNYDWNRQQPTYNQTYISF